MKFSFFISKSTNLIQFKFTVILAKSYLQISTLNLMTSFDLDAIERLRTEQQQKIEKFELWCIAHDKKSLSMWMSSHAAETQDLLAANLISYPDPSMMPVSWHFFHSDPIFTQNAGDLISTYSNEAEQIDGGFDFAYLTDELRLFELLKGHLAKSDKARTQDFIHEHQLKHGSKPSKQEIHFKLQLRKMRLKHNASSSNNAG